MQPRITYLIKWIERGVRGELDAALRPLDVATPEYTALSVLRERQGLSSAQLARRAFVSGQAMNQIVIGLERKGWIMREADPGHGKILRARLTPRGLTVLSACDRATAHVERELLGDLSREEISVLRRALSQCASTLTDTDGALPS